MIFAALLINSLLLTASIVNFFTIRKPDTVRSIEKSVVALLPVRNEEVNIERVIHQLESQVSLSNFRVIVIDDNSEDFTLAKAQALTSSRISVLSAPAPLDGWLGKVSALQYGFSSIDFEPDYIVSIDADVSFEPTAIARSISTIERLELDFISPYPRQAAISFPERLAQPLLQWSWMSTLILRLSEKMPLPSTVVCNGQFLVLRYSALKTIGGFSSVAHKVLDDIELGRSLVKSGFKGTVIDGSKIASTRMYSSFAELRSGYGKSLHTAFGSLPGSIFVAIFMLFTGFLPFLFALQGDSYAIGACIAIIVTRIVSAFSASTRIRDALLHPLSALLFTYLLYFSWLHRKSAQWKGRRV